MVYRVPRAGIEPVTSGKGQPVTRIQVEGKGKPSWKVTWTQIIWREHWQLKKPVVLYLKQYKGVWETVAGGKTCTRVLKVLVTGACTLQYWIDEVH